MPRTLAAVGASRGLALGRARVREPQGLQVEARSIADSEIASEIARLHAAFAATHAELEATRTRLPLEVVEELGELLDVHALILGDPELVQGLDDMIRIGRYEAAYALRLQRDRLAAVFNQIDDPYLRSRREDFDHVIGRIHAHLRRDTATVDGVAGEVLVCESVSPQEIAQLADRGVVAVVTVAGSALSHSAILARSMHLPMLVGATQALRAINDGDMLMVNGATGELVVDPAPQDLRRFQSLRTADARERRALSRLRGAATRTLDGVDIGLSANAESPADVAEAHALGAGGIGLYRTEFLFLQRSALPTEDEQFIAYRDLVLAMGGRPVTIRTLDLGADKAHDSALPLPDEANPALGLRGLRLSLARGELFRTQLRAILRASAYGPVRILLPMVGWIEEIRAARAVLDDCRRELQAQGHAPADDIRLGGMIEVPSAALTVDLLARELDFFAIGTNDLLQYLLATDRDNDAVAELYSPLHPAVIRLLHQVLQACRAAGRPVSVCGELAGDPRYTRLLLALGLTEFSLHPSTLLEVRRAVRESDLKHLRRRTAALLRAGDRAALERLVERLG